MKAKKYINNQCLKVKNLQLNIMKYQMNISNFKRRNPGWYYYKIFLKLLIDYFIWINQQKIIFDHIELAHLQLNFLFLQDLIDRYPLHGKKKWGVSFKNYFYIQLMK
jgi:hypothetical protein